MRRHNPPYSKLQRLYLAVALLLVTAIGTAAWTSTTFAKYVTSVSFSDSARVARFVVNASSNSSDTLTIASDAESASYTFTVSNSDSSGTSEVATSYDVTVTFLNDPANLTLALTNGSMNISGTKTGNAYTFKNAGTLQPGTAQTDKLTLTFTRTNYTQSVSWSGITVSVNATQVD